MKNKLLTTFINDTSTQSSLSVVYERWSSWKELTDIKYTSKCCKNLLCVYEFQGHIIVVDEWWNISMDCIRVLSPYEKKKREKQSFFCFCLIINFMYICGNKTHFSCINAKSMSHFTNLWIKRFYGGGIWLFWWKLWGANTNILNPTNVVKK